MGLPHYFCYSAIINSAKCTRDAIKTFLRGGASTSNQNNLYVKWTIDKLIDNIYKTEITFIENIHSSLKLVFNPSYINIIIKR